MIVVIVAVFLLATLQGVFPLSQAHTTPDGLDVPPMKDRMVSPAEQRMIEDLLWAESSREVRQYVGKLVVVHRKRVIAVGTDQDELIRQAAAQEKCPEAELVVVPMPQADCDEVPLTLSRGLKLMRGAPSFLPCLCYLARLGPFRVG